jgi:hypothetical protein
VIPGVVISGSSGVQAQVGQAGFDDLQTTLRLFPPGSKSARVSVTVLAEDGSVAGQPTTSTVPGGRVTDLQLASLSDGNYTVVVTSTTPVVGSVRVSTANAAVAASDAGAASGSGSGKKSGKSSGKSSGASSGTPSGTTTGTTTGTTAGTGSNTDFAWMTAAPMLTTSALVSVPSGMTPLLHLENPTSEPETVQVAGLDGTSQAVTVAGHSATSVTVVAATTYELSGFTQLYASVSGASDAGITSYVVSPPTRSDASVRVYG